MHLLIASATIFEVEILLNHYPFKQLNNCYRYSKNQLNISILITGVGSTQTLFSLQDFAHHHPIDIAIQVGIAGVVDGKFNLGDVVQIESEIIADEGVYEDNQYRNLFDMGFIDSNQHPFTNGCLVNYTNTNWLPMFNKVQSQSIHLIETNTERLQQLQLKYNCDVESMEGAAFFYVMIKKKIPFHEIRAISNYIGERNKDKWQMPIAIENLNKAIIQTIENLINFKSK